MCLAGFEMLFGTFCIVFLGFGHPTHFETIFAILAIVSAIFIVWTIKPEK